MAPPALWSRPRPTRSAARSRPPRAETPPLPATCRWPGSLLRSQPVQPSHGRGNASSRPFRSRSLGRTRDISDLVPRVSVGVVPCFAGHAVPLRHLGSQKMVDDRRIALAAASIRPVMVFMRKSQVMGCHRGPFEIRVSPAGYRGFDRLFDAALPDDTHRGATDAGRPVALGKARQSSNSSGCGSERQDRNIATTGISLFRLFTQFPSWPPHFSFCLSCMTCWSQLSSRPQRLSPIFFP